MQANTDFIFTLGADISRFTKSITEVEAELKSVKNTLKTETRGAIVETNAYIQQLEQTLVDLKKVGFSGVASSAQKGQTALFALGQVARDLPFGFIAIQNNLPLLVDQFVALRNETKSTSKALGEILNSIAGPAGLAFAFGVVTSAITGLVQQYGSLSNAFGQIFGLVSRTKIATEDYEKAQIKSTAAGIAEAKSIDNLIKILSDSKQPYSNRLGAYEGLKSIMPDVISALDKEKTINGENIIQLQKLATLKKENIILDGTRQAIVQAIQKETENALTKISSLTKQDFFGKIGDALKGILKGFPPFIAAQMEAIDQANQSADAYDFLSKTLDGLDVKIAANNGIIDQQIEKYKKQVKALEDAKKAAENYKGFWLGFAPAAVIAGDEFNKVLKKNAEEAKNLEGWRNIILQIAQAYDITSTSLGNTQIYLKSTDKIINQVNASFDAMFQNMQDADLSFGADIAQQKLNNLFKKIDENTKSTTKTFKSQYNNIANIIESSLIQPLTYLFDTVLEGGKISWKEFGQIVLDQLKRILVQVLATTAAIAIADALTNGGYSATARLADKATGGGGGFTRSRSSAVNFGGVGQGGLAMTGAVSLSLRGADLVGAINRTNTNISRIG